VEISDQLHAPAILPLEDSLSTNRLQD